MNGALAHKTLLNIFSSFFFQLIERVNPNQLEQNTATSASQPPEQANYYVWLDLGNIFTLDSKYEQAVVAYNRASQLQPDRDEAWLQKGKALASLGEFSAAMVAIEQAIALSPDNYQARYQKAKVLQKLNRDSQAQSCLVECLNEFTEIVAAESHVYTLPWYR